MTTTKWTATLEELLYEHGPKDVAQAISLIFTDKYITKKDWTRRNAPYLTPENGRPIKLTKP